MRTAHYYPSGSDGVIPTFIPFQPPLEDEEEEEEEGGTSFALHIGGEFFHRSTQCRRWGRGEGVESRRGQGETRELR